ncbi:hypothetical protein BX070DRAFT_230206 [Coemansia spiralis]|nr:hypothetical protein BX070DRAFT_230206 [Coemansia spiralis]
MDTVVDLTDSPPLTTTTATNTSSQQLAASISNAPVLVSSDDEDNGTSVVSTSIAPGVRSLPEGYILPPIRRLSSNERGRPERITTLREILSTQSSRNRGRSGMSRARRGQNVPSSYAQAPVFSTATLHTGEEPIEPGVYMPIRSRPMLRHERQRQQQQQRSHGVSESVAAAGRQTADGSIDVEDVDASAYSEQAARNQVRMRRLRNPPAGAHDHVFDDDMDIYDLQDSESDTPGVAANRQAYLQYLMSLRNSRGQVISDVVSSDRVSDAGPATRTRSHRHAYIFPIHPGLISRNFGQRSSSRLSPFDFYAGDDFGSLMSFLEAATPVPPSRPLSPMEPIKEMSAGQKKLEATDAYSRKVPDANFRDSVTSPAVSDVEVVCTQCVDPLFDKEPIWAPSCGHLLCNRCVESITGASKKCTACSKRVMKKSLVHLYA